MRGLVANLSLAEWTGQVEGLKEALEGVLMTIDFGQREEVRPDILFLEAADELDQFMVRMKQDLGI